MLPVSIFMALTFFSQFTFPDSGADQVFAQGLESFKRSELAQSRESFSQLIKEHPQDPLLLYNLGLVEMKDNHPGRAFAYWRKALYLSPGYGPAIEGVSFLNSKKFPAAQNISFLQKIYWRIPSSIFSTLGIVFFALGGILLIRQFSFKKLGRTSYFFTPVSFLFFGFCFLSLFFHNYFYVHTTAEATIMEASVPAHSSPNDDSPALFEFKEGDAVAVRRESAEWVQVQKTATSLGWIKKNQLFIHSGASSTN